MKNKSHILILGGTGFLGRSINNSNISKKFEITNINSKRLDLRKNDLVEQLIELYDEKSTIIFLSAVKRNLGDSLSSYEMNIKIALTVISAIQKKPIQNLIYLSSCSVYGEKNNQVKVSENSELNPTSFYGASKVAIEELLKLMQNENKIKNLAILRPTTIYGDIKIPTYCPSGFIRKAIKENKIELWGNGDEVRDFFYIEDFIKVIEKILEEPTNLLLNLCSGESISFLEIAQKITFYLNTVVINNRPRTNKLVNHSYENLKLKKFKPDLKFENPLIWIDYFFKTFNNKS